MPELPEVQTIVEDLKAAGIEGTVITGATVFWSRTIAEPSASAFCRRIKSKKISSIRRRGKFIVFDFKKGDNLLMHLRMSGRLHLMAAGTKRSKHEHVVLGLDDGIQIHRQVTDAVSYRSSSAARPTRVPLRKSGKWR